MNHYGTLRRFIFIWITYWITYYIQPAQSIYDGIETAWLIQFLFVFIVIGSFISGAALVTTTGEINNIKRTQHADIFAEPIIRWGLIISLIGLLCLIYDKLFIQTIDFSQNLAESREQWRQAGEERDGAISSGFSVLGYVLGGAYFLPLALTVHRDIAISATRRLFYLSLCLVLLLVNSIATGGRSSILMALFLVSFSIFTTKTDGRVSIFSRTSVRFGMLLISGIFFTYTCYIFYLRSVASDIIISKYSIEFLDYLGLEPAEWFETYSAASDFGGVLALLNLAASYLTHSLATMAAITQYSGDSRDAFMVYFYTLASKIGFAQPPQEWFLAGRFPSLPGALYLKFDLIGMIIGACILGLVAGIVSGRFAIQRFSIINLYICCITELILLMSPFVFAGEFLFFPFMVFSALILIAVAAILQPTMTNEC